jgi:hypothetical protein
MDELKQIKVTESNNIQEDTLMEDAVMKPSHQSKLIPLTIMVGILVGLGTGFYVAQKQLLLAGSGASLLAPTTQELTSNTTIKVGDVFGSADEKTFRDQADGVLMSGGIEGEGSHHLERGDNKSQWVYVTSSVVDLDLLVGDRVTIWGETNQGKKAGWLMDVGRLKVLELDVATPEVSGDQE